MSPYEAVDKIEAVIEHAVFGEVSIHFVDGSGMGRFLKLEDFESVRTLLADYRRKSELLEEARYILQHHLGPAPL